MLKSKASPTGPDNSLSITKLAEKVDLNRIVINAVTTKGEFRQLLLNQGVLNLVAQVLREIYESKESEWPKNVEEYLLRRFLNEIPIVKQMRLMSKNFDKRTLELETNGKEKLDRLITHHKNERMKTLLLIESEPTPPKDSAEDETRIEHVS